MDFLRNGKTPLFAAHRGLSGGNIPCNSRAAFQAALLAGADIVELDVSISRDGELFCFHPGMEPAHLDRPELIKELLAAEVAERYYVNQDDKPTHEKILTLDEAFEMLKGKCPVNVDKFWTQPKKIADCIRRHGMEKQVIVKTPAKEVYFDAVEEVAPEMAYMPVIKNEDTVSEQLLGRNIRIVGIEACFEREDAQVVSEAHIAWLHKNALALWGNAIVYNKTSIISAGHTDDLAVTGDPDLGWGWFADKGFDIVQTDWLPLIRQYFEKR